MALPQATKTDYGNADDITPLEMNNIGENLEALDQDYRYYAGSTGNAVGGTANNIVLTSGAPDSKPYLAYKDNQRAAFRPAGTNTSGFTIAQDGLPAKAGLKRSGGVKVPLVSGDVVFNVETLFVFSTASDAWILESNPNAAVLNAPNLHTADISVKNPGGTVQRRTHLDPRGGNENIIWNGVNLWHNGAIWKFDDSTKPGFLQLFDVVSNEFGYYNAPANSGGDPVLVKIMNFGPGALFKFGAGDVLRTDRANICTADQRIIKDTAAFVVDSSLGSPAVVLNRSGATSVTLAGGINGLDVWNGVGSTVFKFDTTTAKMTLGTVPHQRHSIQWSAAGTAQTTSLIINPVSVGDILLITIMGLGLISSTGELVISTSNFGAAIIYDVFPQVIKPNTTGADKTLYATISGVATVTGSGSLTLSGVLSGVTSGHNLKMHVQQLLG